MYKELQILCNVVTIIVFTHVSESVYLPTQADVLTRLMGKVPSAVGSTLVILFAPSQSHNGRRLPLTLHPLPRAALLLFLYYVSCIRAANDAHAAIQQTLPSPSFSRIPESRPESHPRRLMHSSSFLTQLSARLGAYIQILSSCESYCRSSGARKRVAPQPAGDTTGFCVALSPSAALRWRPCPTCASVCLQEALVSELYKDVEAFAKVCHIKKKKTKKEKNGEAKNMGRIMRASFSS